MSSKEQLPNPNQDPQMGRDLRGDTLAHYRPTTHTASEVEQSLHAEAPDAAIELTGAEIVWATLEGEGVREVFRLSRRRHSAGV